MRRGKLVFWVMLMSCCVAQADDHGSAGFATGWQDASDWQQHAQAEQDYQEYLQTVEINQKHVSRLLHDYSVQLQERLDGYGTAASVAGVMVGLAVADQRYQLNDSKTMGLVVRDSTGSDRALLLEYRRHW